MFAAGGVRNLRGWRTFPGVAPRLLAVPAWPATGQGATLANVRQPRALPPPRPPGANGLLSPASQPATLAHSSPAGALQTVHKSAACLRTWAALPGTLLGKRPIPGVTAGGGGCLWLQRECVFPGKPPPKRFWVPTSGRRGEGKGERSGISATSIALCSNRAQESLRGGGGRHHGKRRSELMQSAGQQRQKPRAGLPRPPAGLSRPLLGARGRCHTLRRPHPSARGLTSVLLSRTSNRPGVSLPGRIGCDHVVVGSSGGGGMLAEGQLGMNA